MIKAIIFDFDGLILDTETSIFRSWQEVYSQYGCELTLEEWAPNLGTEDIFDPVVHLEGILGLRLDKSAIRSGRKPREATLIEAEPILPGVETYIADAKRLNVKLAVASNSDRNWVAGHLERLGLIHHFNVVRCWNDPDVGQRKPQPAVYDATLAALGISAVEAIALEDSFNGILSATRAGMFTVAVPNTLTKTIGVGVADIELESMIHMPLEELLRLAEQRRSQN